MTASVQTSIYSHTRLYNKRYYSGNLYTVYVNTEDGDSPYLNLAVFDGAPGGGLRQFSNGGYDSSSSLYILDGMTIIDGWGRELYYYSAPPYQSYRLWSAGPNGRTFPPWYDLNSLDSSARKVVTTWTKDDLSHLEK